VVALTSIPIYFGHINPCHYHSHGLVGLSSCPGRLEFGFTAMPYIASTGDHLFPAGFDSFCCQLVRPTLQQYWQLFSIKPSSWRSFRAGQPKWFSVCWCLEFFTPRRLHRPQTEEMNPRSSLSSGASKARLPFIWLIFLPSSCFGYHCIWSFSLPWRSSLKNPSSQFLNGPPFQIRLYFFSVSVERVAWLALSLNRFLSASTCFNIRQLWTYPCGIIVSIVPSFLRGGGFERSCLSTDSQLYTLMSIRPFQQDPDEKCVPVLCFPMAIPHLSIIFAALLNALLSTTKKHSIPLLAIAAADKVSLY
jgi:hypothetical protein